MSTKKKLVLSFATMLVATIFFIVWIVSWTTRHTNEQLATTQGVLAYNHYKDFAALEELLQRGCIERLKQEIVFRKNLERDVLIDNLHAAASDDLTQYIGQRDQALLSDVENSTPKRKTEEVAFSPCEK